MAQRWSLIEDKLLRDNYQQVASNIEKLLPNRSAPAINQRASKLGLRKIKNYYLNTRCDLLLNDTCEIFYWIGFILADGYISNRYRLTIQLAIKDKSHLEKIALLLKTKISYHNKYTYPACSISCMDKFNIKKLADKFNIKNNKTYIPPKTFFVTNDKRLLMSLIIGLIDGDGCIKHQSNRSDAAIHFHCHATWLDYYSEIVDFLSSEFNINMKKPIIGKDGYMRHNISNHVIINNLKKLAIEYNLPVLNRKWDIIDLSRKYKTDSGNALKQYIISNPNKKNKEIKNVFNVTASAVSQARSKLRKLGLIQ